MNILTSESKTSLLTKMHEFFDLAELEFLCISLNKDFEDFAPTAGKPLRISSLLSFFERHGRIPEMLDQLRWHHRKQIYFCATKERRSGYLESLLPHSNIYLHPHGEGFWLCFNL